MSEKIGGLYISLGLDLAEFDAKSMTAADRVEKMASLGSKLDDAMEKGTRSTHRLAEKMVELSGAGSHYGSIVSSVVRSYEIYEGRLTAIIEKSGAVATSFVKIQAAAAAMQATFRAFAPLLVLDGLIKLGQSATEVWEKAKKEAEDSEKYLTMEPRVNKSHFLKDYAEIQARAQEGGEDTERFLKKLYEGGAIDEREFIKRMDGVHNRAVQAAREMEELGNIRAADKIERELRTEQIGQLKGIERIEAQINERYMERRGEVWKITEARTRDTVLAELSAAQDKELANARFEEEQKQMAQAAADHEKSENVAKKYAQDVLSHWEKIVKQAEKFSGLVQGVGHDTGAALMGSLSATGQLAGATGGPDINAAAAFYKDANIGTLGSDEVKGILQNMLDALRTDQSF